MTEERPEEGPIFCCAECGGHQAVVIHEFTACDPYEVVLPCTCEDGEQEEAVTRRYDAVVQCRRVGLLDEDHRVIWPPDDDLESQEEEIDRVNEEEEIHCRHCLAEAESDEWQVERGEREVDETEDEIYVRCRDCDHEVEFGWSHPNRGGRIWPAESPHFNPWKTCPDPKYSESWKAKGWLRPSTPRRHRGL